MDLLSNIFMLKIIGFIFTTLVLSIAVVVFLSKYPRYAVYIFMRFFAFRAGLRRKNVEISRSVTMAYYEKGHRKRGHPTLLLIHGFSSTKDNFLGVARFLPRNVHMIAIDLPGHGGSTFKDKDDLTIMSFVHYIKKFADTLDLPPNDFHLLGSSMGGHIAAMYAVTYPNDLTSLTLVCPHGIENRLEKQIEDEYKRTGKFALLPDTADGYIELVNFITHKDIKIPKWYAEGAIQIRNSYFNVFKQVAENLTDKQYRHLLEENIGRITTPLFILWGRNDRVIDLSCIDVMKKNLPSPPMKEVIVDECGHSVLLERPRKSAQLVTDFLNSFYAKV